MRSLELWLAAALYETVRRGLPDLCTMSGRRKVNWLDWEHAPQAAKQEFIKFAKGILEGVFGYLEEERNATSESTQGGEQETEEESDGGGHAQTF
jgi:hypothetical protein